MQTVIITIHLLVVIALVGVILIQRSEGGGLGIGGGSGFMSARGTKNTLTRITAILALCFFLTSFILTVLQLVPSNSGSNVLDQITQQGQNHESDNLLDNLPGGNDQGENQGSSNNSNQKADSNNVSQQDEVTNSQAGSEKAESQSEGTSSTSATNDPKNAQ